MPAGRDGQGGVDAPCGVNTTPPSAAAGASETSYDRLFLPYRRLVESESLSTPTKWISIPRRKSDARMEFTRTTCYPLGSLGFLEG